MYVLYIFNIHHIFYLVKELVLDISTQQELIVLISIGIKY